MGKPGGLVKARVAKESLCALINPVLQLVRLYLIPLPTSTLYPVRDVIIIKANTFARIQKTIVRAITKAPARQRLARGDTSNTIGTMEKSICQVGKGTQ